MKLLKLLKIKTPEKCLVNSIWKCDHCIICNPSINVIENIVLFITLSLSTEPFKDLFLP